MAFLPVDADNLRLLADWLDKKFEGIETSTDIQDDLRRMADTIDAILDG